jgi:hypothetical protein
MVYLVYFSFLWLIKRQIFILPNKEECTGIFVKTQQMKFMSNIISTCVGQLEEFYLGKEYLMF